MSNEGKKLNMLKAKKKLQQVFTSTETILIQLLLLTFFTITLAEQSVLVLKLDFVAEPGKFGAMENWGLVTADMEVIKDQLLLPLSAKGSKIEIYNVLLNDNKWK